MSVAIRRCGVEISILALPAHAQRDTIPLNTDWRFAVGSEAPEKEPWKGRPIPHARIVWVPHTWNVEEVHQHHYGWAWYQGSVIVPAEWKDRFVALEIGAGISYSSSRGATCSKTTPSRRVAAGCWCRSLR
jgi:hypothetical protein